MRKTVIIWASVNEKNQIRYELGRHEFKKVAEPDTVRDRLISLLSNDGAWESFGEPDDAIIISEVEQND